MSDIRFNSLDFSRGIDCSTDARDETVLAMPERGDAAPLGGRSQLDILLQPPSLDSRLDAVLCPQRASRELLSPGRFQAALTETIKNLREVAEKAPDDQSRVLNRALRLLNEELHLRDLLQMYRNALYQG